MRPVHSHRVIKDKTTLLDNIEKRQILAPVNPNLLQHPPTRTVSDDVSKSNSKQSLFVGFPKIETVHSNDTLNKDSILNLQKRVKELEKENFRLNHHVQQAEQSIKNYRDMFNNQLQQPKGLNSPLSPIEDTSLLPKHKELQAQITTLQTTNHELTTKNQQLHNENHKLLHEIQHSNKQKEQLQLENGKLIAKCTQEQLTVHTVQRQYDQLTQRYQLLTTITQQSHAQYKDALTCMSQVYGEEMEDFAKQLQVLQYAIEQLLAMKMMILPGTGGKPTVNNGGSGGGEGVATESMKSMMMMTPIKSSASLLSLALLTPKQPPSSTTTKYYHNSNNNSSNKLVTNNNTPNNKSNNKKHFFADTNNNNNNSTNSSSKSNNNSIPSPAINTTAALRGSPNTIKTPNTLKKSPIAAAAVVTTGTIATPKVTSLLKNSSSSPTTSFQDIACSPIIVVANAHSTPFTPFLSSPQSHHETSYEELLATLEHQTSILEETKQALQTFHGLHLAEVKSIKHLAHIRELLRIAKEREFTIQLDRMNTELNYLR